MSDTPADPSERRAFLGILLGGIGLVVSAAAAWRFLEQRYAREGKSLFDWRRSQERGLGVNEEYRG